MTEVHMAKDTKERILAAALEMFSQKGYAGTNIRELTASRLRQLPKAKTAVTCGKWGYLCQILKNILLYGVVFSEIL